MRKNLPKHSELRQSANPPTVVCPDLGHLLAAQFTDRGRLAFARALTLEIICNWHRARGIGISDRPPGFELIPLSTSAKSAAAQFAASIASIDVASACYAIGSVYTAALPDPYRAANGVFYTPVPLAECLIGMCENAGMDWRTARVLDPACGGGVFLLGVAARMIAAMRGTEPAFIIQQLGTRLRGFDNDPFGAWLAQKAIEVFLFELTVASDRPVPKIVETRDSLESREVDEAAYDLVIGNPPYGRVSLPPERRKLFARSIYGHANQFGLFTDAALRWAKEGGVIAYVTPPSMLSGLYYKALRGLLSLEAPPLAVHFVEERDGVFSNVLQETMLATYRRGGFPRGGNVGVISIAPDGGARSKRAGNLFLPSQTGAPWILPRSAEQAALTRRLRAMPHRLADYGYRVSTGPLVWNRHKGQFRAEATAGSDRFPVIWAESVTSDGRFVWRSERRNHAPWFAACRPRDDWLIVDRPCVLVQRTTAKEQLRRLIAAELPASFIRKHQGVVIENHLNMVWANAPKPKVTARTLALLLKSAVIDTAFRCMNGSVAVSAFELESLPLPSPTRLAIIDRMAASGAPAGKIEAAFSAAYVRGDAAAVD